MMSKLSIPAEAIAALMTADARALAQEALRPFAAVALGYPSPQFSDDYSVFGKIGHGLPLKLFRRAAAALAALTAEPAVSTATQQRSTKDEPLAADLARAALAQIGKMLRGASHAVAGGIVLDFTRDEWAIVAAGVNASAGGKLGPSEAETRMRQALERDRSEVAGALARIRARIASWEHLSGPGRGSYAWDDDEWKTQFGFAIQAIADEVDGLSHIAGDKTDCPETDAEVKVSRATGRLYLGPPPRKFRRTHNLTPPEGC